MVAAALRARCRRLYTEDLRDGVKIEELTVINPFQASACTGS
jgi:predicted nucleic acid-binding protein